MGGRRFVKHPPLAVPSDPLHNIIISEDMTEKDAHQAEMLLICYYGRADAGTGILHNRTDGGDGTSGLIHTPEARKKMSDKALGVPKSPEAAAKNSEWHSGRKLSPETINRMVATRSDPKYRENLSNKIRDKWKDPEYRAKTSNSQKVRHARNRAAKQQNLGEIR